MGITLPAMAGDGKDATALTAVYSESALKATAVSYSQDMTTVTFRVVADREEDINVGRDIALVDDNGVRHRVLNAKGIDLGTTYSLRAGQDMTFDIGFEPVARTGKALDVMQDGRLTILGLHEAGTKLDIPMMDYKLRASMPITGRTVTVEGMVHGAKGRKTTVCLQYVKPEGLGVGYEHPAEVSADGHFNISYTMYAPQRVLIYTYGDIRMSTTQYISPDDAVRIDIYPDSIIECRTSATDIKTDRLTALPGVGVDSKYRANLRNGIITNTDTDTSASYTPFSSISYAEQHQQLMEAYRQQEEMVRYVRWRCRLNDDEASIYTCQLHDRLATILMSTDERAANMYEEAATEEVKKEYLPATLRDTYDYLKLIPADDPTFILIDSNIPTQLAQVKMLTDCYKQVPQESAHWCTEVMKLQVQALQSVTGWTPDTFMSQLTQLSLLNHIQTQYKQQMKTSGDELYTYLRHHLTDAYCRSVLDEMKAVAD